MIWGGGGGGGREGTAHANNKNFHTIPGGGGVGGGGVGRVGVGEGGVGGGVLKLT